MKKILSFFMLMFMCLIAQAQTTYNIIATAYVTTTISQNVVFDSTMKAGGTFTFSALAHNGGGRANEPDTANVRIQFFNSANQQLGAAVTSSYNRNLPIPTAVNPPGADPNVPWTVLTVSSTNCGGSCANVAYATVSMYGIDTSYWAGDYGPWYRAPTFTLNGGPNLVYNPEFGPAYGYNAQGWTTSPAMGACQGAWGGSNPCIVNSAGVPGSSTTGLVANQNGGGPSTSGGTTSGTAGGYNNTMTTSNAGPGTGLGPSVTGTSTTYSSSTTTSGNTRTTTTTPTTVTTYSDGTSTSSNGTPTVTTVSRSAVTSGIISQYVPTSYNSPGSEQAPKAFDGTPNTKYLNFDKFNAGVTVHLTTARAVSGLTFTTANDFPGRDPTAYTLYGSNDGVHWTLLAYNQPLTLSDNRYTVSAVYDVNNTTAYYYYFITFPGTKAGSGCGQNCNSMQIGEITYYYWPDASTTATDGGNGTISNPGTAGAVIGGGTTGSTAPSMNVAGGGSDHVFIWDGNSGNDWVNVQKVQPGWYWTCDTCSVTMGVVIGVENPASDTIYFYLADMDGNPVYPDSGNWYTFTSTSPRFVVSVGTSDSVTTTSTTGSTDTTTNTYTWGGGTYTVIGEGTPTTTTTTTTPVTTTYWSDNTTTSSNGNPTTTSNINWDYSVTQQMLNPPVSPYRNTNTNGIYIQQINAGSVNKVKANQSGHGNYEEIRLGGSNNNINVGQGYTFSTTGVATESLSASIENVSGINLSGNSNTVTNSQLGQANSTVLNITGNNNNATLTQNGNNNQAYSKINGANNSITIGQTGNSNVAAVDLFGTSNTASVIQTGNNHGTVLNLINAGGANNVSVIQTGVGDAYSLQQICTNPAGCSVSVIRNK